MRIARCIEDNPKCLLRLLIAVMTLSAVFILALTTFGIYGVYSRQIIASAEGDAIQTSHALLIFEQEGLLASLREKGRSLSGRELSWFDRRFRQFLHPFGIVKIKVYDAGSRIVYSTDPAAIGQVDDGNPRLARSLAGFNDSKLEKKEQVLDLADETKIDVDVVETYVPIRDGEGGVIGALEIYQDVTRHRSEIRLTLIKSILVLTVTLLVVFAAAIRILKTGTDHLLVAQGRLREMVSRDPLTGILNRRELFSRADQEARRFERRNARSPAGSLGVIMLDIDRFKLINDTYGHAAGDQVLKEVASRIAKTIRASDFVGRYGGEEFLIIMPSVSFEETVALAERIRSVIREVPFSFAGNSFQITASLGAALTGEGPQAFGMALERADEGLYLAKNGGRDRVAWVDVGTGKPAGGPPPRIY